VLVAVEEVGLVAVEAASMWERLAGSVAAAVAREAAARQAPAPAEVVVVGVGPHSLPVAAAVELFRVVAAAVAAAAEADLVAAAGAAGDLHRKESDFRRDPSVERRGPLELLSGAPSIAREVAAFPVIPSFFAQRC